MIKIATKIFCTAVYLLGGTVRIELVILPRTLAMLSFFYFIYIVFPLIKLGYYYLFTYIWA